MLVCLTRALRARYREDVTRVLAYPRGGIVQYRYGLNIVEPAAKDKLQSAKPGSETVALCFVHFDDASRTAKLLPLRLGKLKSSEVVGSSLILNIELGDFIEEKTGADHYRGVQVARGNVVPHYDPKVPGKAVSGFFVFSADEGLFGGPRPNMVAGFEATVNALAAFPLFKESKGEGNPSSLFFHVLGLRTLSGGFPKYFGFVDSVWSPPAFQAAAPFTVMSGARCELEVYHYSPEIGRPDETTRKQMKASSPSALIEFISDTKLAIDSEYDVKRLMFDVERSSTSHLTVIDLFVLSSDEKTDHAKLNLPVRIRWNFILVKLQVIAIAAGVSLPGLIVLMSSGRTYDKWTIPLMLFSGLVVGLAATFGVKRGI